MNKENVVSSDLDNTVHNPDVVKNSNVPAQEIVDDEENDIEECDVDVMTGSYGEISLEQELIAAAQGNGFCETKDSPSSKTTEDDDEDEEEKNASPESDKNILHTNEDVQCLKESRRPNSLVLARNTSDIGRAPTGALKFPEGGAECPEPWKKIHKSQQTSDSQTTSVDGSPSFSSEEYAICSPRHQRTGSDTSGLTDLQGTITVDGDMVSFVADDLQEKIRLSSPVSRWTDSPSYPGSRSSTPSLYRQALQPHIPAIDPSAVIDLEVHARKVATCVDTMLGNLSGTLQSISSLTVDYMETYEKSVCKTCDTIDTGIKTMYQLMAKCEELSNSVKPLYKLSQDIKDIKKVLDHFESAVEHKS